MNKTIFMGRLTRDVELLTVNGANGQFLTGRFGLAVNGRRKDDPADFFECSVLGKRAEVISQYCHKGDRILIFGRMQVRPGTDKNGQKRTYYTVVVEDFDFIESKTTAHSASAPAQGNANPNMNTPANNGDEFAEFSEDTSFYAMGDEEIPF